jgi:hypothetical protein
MGVLHIILKVGHPISRDLTLNVYKYVAWREQVRLPIVQFVDDVRALINGGNFHRFNILNQYF